MCVYIYIYWAVGSALDILAPDTPTHFNSRHSNAILDIGFAVNLSHTEVFTINTLSSDHNPVIFDFVTNNALPPILRTLKTTNWIKFQEIISHTIPGNPRIDDLDLAVQNFTSNILNAISASTSTRLITTPHLRLPENIRELIRAKNRFRKLWNETRYPPYKREVNALIRQIRREIQEHKNRTWKDFLLTLNPEDNSLYNLHRKFSKRHIPFHLFMVRVEWPIRISKRRRFSKIHLKSHFRKMKNPTVTTRLKKLKV
ncbi:uncharacterized protein TNCV_4362741 [Trichonephila clavipes]|nr:uncharacterized protein TNCV_4362741 [Trichonephila clavipes]